MQFENHLRESFISLSCLRKEVKSDFLGVRRQASFFPVARLRASTSVHCAEYSCISLNQFLLILDQNQGITINPLKDMGVLLLGLGIWIRIKTLLPLLPVNNPEVSVVPTPPTSPLLFSPLHAPKRRDLGSHASVVALTQERGSEEASLHLTGRLWNCGRFSAGLWTSISSLMTRGTDCILDFFLRLWTLLKSVVSFCEWGGGGAIDLIFFLSFILPAVTAQNVSKRGHASAILLVPCLQLRVVFSKVIIID